MVEKTFCDKCGKDITNDEIFVIEIYDRILERNRFQIDMCIKCMKKIEKLIKNG